MSTMTKVLSLQFQGVRVHDSGAKAWQQDQRRAHLVIHKQEPESTLEMVLSLLEPQSLTSVTTPPSAKLYLLVLPKPPPTGDQIFKCLRLIWAFHSNDHRLNPALGTVK